MKKALIPSHSAPEEEMDLTSPESVFLIFLFGSMHIWQANKKTYSVEGNLATVAIVLAKRDQSLNEEQRKVKGLILGNFLGLKPEKGDFPEEVELTTALKEWEERNEFVQYLRSSVKGTKRLAD